MRFQLINGCKNKQNASFYVFFAKCFISFYNYFRKFDAVFRTTI